MTKLRMETGHSISNDVVEIQGDKIRFVTADDRTMFEVFIRDDRSIEVRGVEICKIGERLFTRLLQIEPNMANNITIRTQPYER